MHVPFKNESLSPGSRTKAGPVSPGKERRERAFGHQNEALPRAVFACFADIKMTKEQGARDWLTDRPCGAPDRASQYAGEGVLKYSKSLITCFYQSRPFSLGLQAF